MHTKSHIRFLLLIAVVILVAGCTSREEKVIANYIAAHPAATEVVVIPDDILQTDDRQEIYVKMFRVFIHDIRLDDQNRLYLDATPGKLFRKYKLDERYHDFIVEGLKESNESIEQFGSALTPEMLERAKQEIMSFKKAPEVK